MRHGESPERRPDQDPQARLAALERRADMLLEQLTQELRALRAAVDDADRSPQVADLHDQ